MTLSPGLESRERKGCVKRLEGSYGVSYDESVCYETTNPVVRLTFEVYTVSCKSINGT